jgi:hypothetical protein
MKDAYLKELAAFLKIRGGDLTVHSIYFGGGRSFFVFFSSLTSDFVPTSFSSHAQQAPRHSQRFVVLLELLAATNALQPQTFKAIIDFLTENCHLSPDVEITMEANPTVVSLAYPHYTLHGRISSSYSRVSR